MRKVKKLFLIGGFAVVTLCSVYSLGTFASPKEELYSLDDYLEDEANNYSTEISANVEKELNELGVLDEEIEAMDEDVLKLIEEGAQYEVQVEYYEIKEREEDEDNNEEINYEYNKMTKKEIDNWINTQHAEEKNADVLESIGAFINDATSTDVWAYSKVDQGGVNSSIFKETLVATLPTGSKDMKIIYTGYWLSPPYYLNLDIFGVKFSNATLSDSDEIKTSYLVRAKDYDNTEKTFSYQRSGLYRGSNGVFATIQLVSDRLPFNRWTILTHTVSLSCTAHLNDKSLESGISGNYIHVETKKNYSVSVGFDGNSVNVSLSAGCSQYQHLMEDNAYLTMQYVERK